jgi:glycyl-tRNA synthetase
MTKDDKMEKIINLCKNRGFVFPGSEIYGGLANSWDYGPLGVELKNNIKRAWWKMFVQERADMVGIDAALIMNPRVWEASGHLKNFSDPLVECKKCHQRFRADQIPPEHKKICGGELTEARMFNMMLKTFLGPVEDESAVVYFRPETAQAMFVDFKQVLNSSRKRVPFGIAQTGKAFRNEITPGNYIFRTREFEQMEIEYFIRENEWGKQFDYWLEEIKKWLEFLDLDLNHLHFREIPEGERAHYSERTIDIDYDFPFGTNELYGLAYRTDFDLTNHQEASGQDMSYTDPMTNEKFIPQVIEPTFGVDRSLLAVLCEHYHEEEAPTAKEGEMETRVVLKLPKELAPYKVAVLPLSKKDELSVPAAKIADNLRKLWSVDYDETQSIGKRYRRQDEIGTSYCVTYDFDSLNDKKVTVRDRDSMKQERVGIEELAEYLKGKM